MTSPRPASLRRRMAAFVYEGVLLFGVVVMAGYLYSTLTQQRHALQGRLGLQWFLFLVLGIYFVWFWTHGGQTVAMKAWRIRLQRSDQQPLTQWQALCRYVLSWMWFMPALSLAYGLHDVHGASISVLIVGGVVIYAVLSQLLPGRQFLHDYLCKTQLIETP